MALRGWLMACLGAGLLLGCAGTETGNPNDTPVRIAIAGISSDPAFAAFGPGQGGLSIGEAWLSLASVSLSPCSADVASPEARDQAVDLARDPPAQVAIETALSELCGARLELAPAPNRPDFAADIIERSVFVRGRRTDGASIEIASALARSIDLVPTPAGTHWQTRSLVVAFDVAVWLRGLGLDNVGRSSGGVVRVDAQTLPAVLSAFESQEPAAMSLHDDANHNGRLDPDEAPSLGVPAPATDAGAPTAPSLDASSQ